MNGETVEFGTSGLLYRSNKLMYDRKTQTLWRQFVGEPVVGPLVGSGIRLKMLPHSLTVWGAWLEEHPDTTVLSLDTGVYPPTTYLPEDNPRSIYADYRRTIDTMFPVPTRSEELAVKEPVFGILVDGEAKAYRVSALAKQQVVNDTVGSDELVIIANVVNINGAAGQRAYDRNGHRFSLASDTPLGATQLLDENGAHWQVGEEGLMQLDDPTQRLERLAGRNAYWFGWFSAYPETDLYLEPENQE